MWWLCLVGRGCPAARGDRPLLPVVLAQLLLSCCLSLPCIVMCVALTHTRNGRACSLHSGPGTEAVLAVCLLNEQLTKEETWCLALGNGLLAKRITRLFIFLEMYVTQEWIRFPGHSQR